MSINVAALWSKLHKFSRGSLFILNELHKIGKWFDLTFSRPDDNVEPLRPTSYQLLNKVVQNVETKSVNQ